MKYVRTVFLIPIFLLTCSLFSPRVFPPPTIFPQMTATSTPRTVASPTEDVASLPVPTLSAADFTPILYRGDLSGDNAFQLIGGVQAGNWLPAAAVVDSLQFEQAYDVYGPSGFAGVATTKDYGAPNPNPRCRETFIGSDFSQDIQNLIAVEQGWQVGYRPWQEIAVNTPLYYGAVAEWLRSQGFPLPAVEINRILLVDLERDGVDEVFISASYFKDESGHMAEQGDYSIILMRKVVGGQVATVPVVADLYTNPSAEQVFPFTYSPVNLLDLNQDGTLDLIVEANRWEGDGVLLFDVEDTNVREVIRTICTQ